ncbi:PIN domain-containing protein [Luteipulveratus halotolerans]|uniref:PIN domain-containing protein n=1 Tax=Luteipulveratus halotolerans TaxID=1631356 RepID=A0A0L6CK65_9MICO|nr:PIN domain-containing protein [Luteipulveratus halotolerans]KNX37913.1 hypothetical protein VV01_13330 [Luteipulveratus halotolerans]
MSDGSLDANVLLRALIDDIPDQGRAARDLIRAGSQWFVDDVAVIEVVFVLGRAYGLDRSQQREATMGVLRQPSISASLDLFEDVFDLYVGHPKLSIQDCYLVVAAGQRRRAPLHTFDRKLANQTDAVLVTLPGSPPKPKPAR